MSKKNYSLSDQIIKSFICLTTIVFALTSQIAAQRSSITTAPPKPAPAAEDFTLWYLTMGLLAVGLAGAAVWFLKSRSAKKQVAPKTAEKRDAWESDSVDADKEMEWLRKNPKITGKKEISQTKNKNSSRLPGPSAKSSLTNGSSAANTANDESAKANTAPDLYLPIFSIRRLEIARPFDELPISDDLSLMDAIEQTYDEMEEDSEVRELAVRILAVFKTRNSVEALSQVALYDLLANLRSKSLTVLSEFDHESVFETILLACADPTREVRAAAARSLTKLTFDRADPWTRIAQSDEEGRVVQAARAAIESGFVDMSFDRLIHQDRKYAYEAFALMALLIKAGETEKLFNALENHKDPNVRKAVLHTIKITKDGKAVEKLYTTLEKGNIPIEFQEEIDKTIEEIGYVTA